MKQCPLSLCRLVNSCEKSRCFGNHVSPTHTHAKPTLLPQHPRIGDTAHGFVPFPPFVIQSPLPPPLSSSVFPRHLRPPTAPN
ncbi:hypothetical protein E2C01_009404 [Portunus trituberculatus]|uniref:Uncharacterized protein n=1 Tax=Portunus trituberculatus TaxID=210409 RepID=A0A5B7D5J0_PORTR|nr:hypothetical protein [Portunus trituberculatus]